MAIWLDKTSLNFGEELIIRTPDVGSNWHKVHVSVLSYSNSFWWGSHYPVFQHYTPALSLMTEIPSGTSATITIKLELFSRDDQSGLNPLATEYAYIPVHVPASVVPTLEGFTATRVAGVPAAITSYVKGYSKVALAMSGVAGAYGSTITKYSITGGGYSSANSFATFGPLGTAGTFTFTANVTDSRGRTASKTVSIIVVNYGLPTLAGVQSFRCLEDGTKSDDGTYIKLKATSSHYDLDGQNPATLSGRIYMSGGAPGAYTAMVNGVGLILGEGVLLLTKSYIAEIIITDLIAANILRTLIPTQRAAIHIIDGALGGAVGKYAEKEGVFESAWPIAGPVGSIATNDSGTSPAIYLIGVYTYLGALAVGGSTLYIYVRTA